jgi:hypothetical protein
MSDIQSTEGRLLASMLEAQGRQLERVEETLQRVTEVLESIGRLDERLGSIQRQQVTDRSEIAAQSERIRIMEVSMPALKEIRRWVIGAVAACFGMIGTGIVAIVVKAVH